MILTYFKQYLNMIILGIFILLFCTACYFKWESSHKDVVVDKAKDNLTASITRELELQRSIDEVIKDLKATREALDFQAEAIKKLDKRKDIDYDKLQQVLKDNVAWSNASVPDGVRSIIKGKTL